MSMRLLLPAALAAGIFCTVAAAQEPPAPANDGDLRALVEAAGDASANGGADRVVVFRRTDVDVEESGLAHIVERQLVKCLSEKGAAELARFRFDYDPTSNMVEVRRVRVLRAGGAVETVDAAKAADLPQPQHMIYWGARMKILQLPRLLPGDAVEVESYTKGFLIAYLDDLARGGAPEDERYIPPMRGHFYDVVFFQDDAPVKLRHYAVRTPKDKPLQFEVYNGEVRTFAGVEGDKLVYRFWKEGLPAYEAEPRAVAPSDVQTKVVLATVPDWRDKSRWFAEVNDRQFAADERIKTKVAELTKGLDDDGKVSAIVHWAADNIRYSGITMGKGEGYTLHPGPMIFEDRSGVCKDKAAMAITMLRAAGFTVYPAMTMAGARVERIPADQFNHCVAALRRKDGTYQLLDPTWVPLSPELWSSAEGEQNYLIGAPEGETLTATPAFDPAAQLLRLDSNASLDAAGTLRGTLVLTATGLVDQRLRRDIVSGAGAADRQAWFEQIVAGIAPGATVEPVAVDSAALLDPRRPLRFEIRYAIPRYALAGDKTLSFALPALRHPFRSPGYAPYWEAAKAPRRTQALQLGASRVFELHETLTPPPGYRVARLPRERKLDGPAAALAVAAETKGNAIVSDYRLTIKRRVVPVDAYANFRAVVQEARALPEDLVVLEREAK